MVYIYILHSSSLGASAGWRKTVATNAATSPHARGVDVFLIKESSSEFRGIQISGVGGCFGVPAVSLIDHWVKQVCKHLGTADNAVEETNIISVTYII